MKCSAVQFSSVQCSAVQWNEVCKLTGSNKTKKSLSLLRVWFIYARQCILSYLQCGVFSKPSTVNLGVFFFFFLLQLQALMWQGWGFTNQTNLSLKVPWHDKFFFYYKFTFNIYIHVRYVVLKVWSVKLSQTTRIPLILQEKLFLL